MIDPFVESKAFLTPLQVNQAWPVLGSGTGTAGKLDCVVSFHEDGIVVTIIARLPHWLKISDAGHVETKGEREI